ncbi:hypothetical protein VP01_3348g1 [Puccinia sorghi]|uniref:Uncharacterized protein n=1 Tax=Puccinia sorghi TaxID=27349 RepID=A0A0L6UXX1_9BASI|nr:hypothetical protein VP01_3348g1 [Puccinia sorghi]
MTWNSHCAVFTVTVHQHLVESLLEKVWSKNRSFLGLSACQLQAVDHCEDCTVTVPSHLHMQKELSQKRKISLDQMCAMFESFTLMNFLSLVIQRLMNEEHPHILRVHYAFAWFQSDAKMNLTHPSMETGLKGDQKLANEVKHGLQITLKNLMVQKRKILKNIRDPLFYTLRMTQAFLKVINE